MSSTTPPVANPSQTSPAGLPTLGSCPIGSGRMKPGLDSGSVGPADVVSPGTGAGGGTSMPSVPPRSLPGPGPEVGSHDPPLPEDPPLLLHPPPRPPVPGSYG